MMTELLPRNKKLNPHSRNLRNNATKQENHLWYEFLKKHPLRFNRQRIIGEYIADFYCSKVNLVIELDVRSIMKMTRSNMINGERPISRV